MKKKFEVFISSKQDEFKRKRKEVAKLISKHPYLESTLLEQKGANTENPIDASVKAVGESDIYIGIFGEKYSEITVKEYREAVKRRIPALLYLKKIKKREPELEDFLENEVKSNFVFHEFSGNKKLLQQIEDDLNDFIFDLLQEGLELYKKRKEKVGYATEDTNKKVTNILKKKETVTYNNFISKLLTKQDYLSVVLGTSISIERLAEEVLAKLWDIETDLQKPLGWVLHRLLDSSLINESELRKVNEIQYIRTDAVHRGRKISKKDADVVFRFGRDVIKKLADIKSKPPTLDMLIKKLGKAKSFVEAIALSHMINKQKEFSRKQINIIANIYLKNIEVYNSFMAAPIIYRILKENRNKLDDILYYEIFKK